MIIRNDVQFLWFMRWKTEACLPTKAGPMTEASAIQILTMHSKFII